MMMDDSDLMILFLLQTTESDDEDDLLSVDRSLSFCVFEPLPMTIWRGVFRRPQVQAPVAPTRRYCYGTGTSREIGGRLMLIFRTRVHDCWAVFQ